MTRGGQGFVIKFRPTSERSPSSMLLEPPFGLNGTEPKPDVPPRWRHIKWVLGLDWEAFTDVFI